MGSTPIFIHGFCDTLGRVMPLHVRIVSISPKTKFMRVNIATLKTAFEAAKIGSARFVSIKNYHNQHGEISNYLINLGMKYADQRDKDINKLMMVSFEGVKEVVRREMLAAKMDNTTDAYRT